MCCVIGDLVVWGCVICGDVLVVRIFTMLVVGGKEDAHLKGWGENGALWKRKVWG